MSDSSIPSSFVVKMENHEQRIISLETRNAVDDVHHENVMDRLSSIEETLKWISRLIIGAIILGMITFILKGGLT